MVCEPNHVQSTLATGEMIGGGRQKELLAASKKSCKKCWVGPADSLDGTGRKIESTFFSHFGIILESFENHLRITCPESA